MKYFHICTDGTNNGVVHFEPKDYQAAIRISAICAEQYDVSIICYCHMTTHSHFVISCNGYSNAERFSEGFKHDYARYVYMTHGIKGIYRGVNSKPKEITDRSYLKKCIAYVLLNPVKAHMVKKTEEYPWSSFLCYYNDSPISGINLSLLSIRKIQRDILHTRHNISSSKLMIDEYKNIIPRSFVDYRFVEKLFFCRVDFYRSLIYTNYDEEENRYVNHSVKYSDDELLAETYRYINIAFNLTHIRDLTKNQKYKVLRFLRGKCGVSNRRLARVLKLPVEEVNTVIEDLGHSETQWAQDEGE